MRTRDLSVYVICCSADEAVKVAKELGPDGLYIRIDGISDEAEAEAIIQRMSAL
jgi:hypothetical protein